MSIRLSDAMNQDTLPPEPAAQETAAAPATDQSGQSQTAVIEQPKTMRLSDALKPQVEPTDLSHFADPSPVDPVLSAADQTPQPLQIGPMPDNVPFIQKVRSSIAQAYEPDKAKSEMIYMISNDTGVSTQEVQKHFDEHSKKFARDAGINVDPSGEEFLNFAVSGAGTAAILANPEFIAPLQIAKSIGSYAAINEISHRAILPAAKAIWQWMNAEPVRYEVTKLSDLMPEGQRDVGTVAEFLLYGAAAHQFTQKILNPVLENPATAMHAKRLQGELAQIRSNILEAFGIKQEKALAPLTSEQIIQAFGGDAAEAARNSKTVFDAELAKRNQGEKTVKAENSQNAPTDNNSTSDANNQPSGQESNPDAENYAPGDISFEFGPEIQDSVTEMATPAISRLLERLTLIEDAVERADHAKNAKEHLEEVRKFFLKRIKPFQGGKEDEEFQGIPKPFVNKANGLPLDEIRMMANDANLGLHFEDDSQVIEFLKSLEMRRAELDRVIDEGKVASITRKETSILKQRIRDIRQGIREGKKITKDEIKDVQSLAVKIINDSGISAEDKAKFLSTVKNIQTQEQFEKALPEIDRRIQTISKRDAVEELRDAFAGLNISQLRPEYRDAVQAIVDSIDLKNRTASKLKELLSLANFVEANPDNQVPAEVLQELRDASKKSVQELSADEVRALADTVKHLIKLNDLKDKLIDRGKLRDFFNARDEAVKNIISSGEDKNGQITGLDSFMKEHEAGMGAKIFGVDSYNAELKTEILDGKDHGVTMRILYDNIDQGVDRQLSHHHQAEDYFKTSLDGIELDKYSSSFQKKSGDIDRVTTKLPSGKSIVMSRGERIAFFLHTLNPLNMKHLVNGGFSFNNSKTKIVKLPPGDIAAIAKSLTPDEMKIAMAMHRYLNVNQRQAINEVSVNLLGFEVANEENYFPIRTNYLDTFKDNLLKKGNYTQKTLEGMGIFKQRQKASNALIVEDVFVAIYKSIHQAGAYIGLAEPLRSAKMMLNDNKFQVAAKDTGRGHYIDSLKNYVDRVEGDSSTIENVDKLTQDLINRLDVAILGLNPWVIAKQPISFISAATELDSKYLKSAGFRPANQAEIDEIKKWSPQLRDRFEGNVTTETGELSQVGRVKKFFTGKEVASTKLMHGIEWSDRIAIAGIWRASKLWVADNYPALQGDDFMKAVTVKAMEVVRRTQSTFHVKDRSPIGMSKNTFVRLLTKYSSERNKNYMVLRRAYEQYNRSEKKPSDKGNLAGKASLIILALPFVSAVIDHVRDSIYGLSQGKPVTRTELQKKQSLDKWRDATNLINNSFGNIYFVGDIVASYLSKLQNGTFSGSDISNPLSGFLEGAINTAADASDAIKFAVSQDRFISGSKRGQYKWEDSAQKAFAGAIETTAKVFGKPVHTILKLSEILFKKIEENL